MQIFKSSGIITNIAVAIFGLCSCAFADETVKETPVITADSVNLSAKTFIVEFVNPSPDKRAIARLYMLGVMDATEGRVWCDYKSFKTVTLNAFVFEYFKKQSPEQLQRRASVVIEEALKNNFPCKGSQ